MEEFKEQDVVSAILAQVENNNKKPQYASKNTFDLKNYFGVYLEKGVNEKQQQVRILPNSDPKNISPFEEVFVHEIQMPSGKWQKFICPKNHGDKPCPFCEARTLLLASGKEQDKKDARTYAAKKMYVVRLIERGKEDEGIKFWRFRHNRTGNGIIDKIIGIIKMRKQDITNPDTGRDLFLDIKRNDKGNATVSTIIDNDVSKLSDNEAQYNEWLNDERTWNDVYAIKPYDYLRIVVEGNEPYYDKDSKKFVTKEQFEMNRDQKANELSSAGEIQMGGGAIVDNGIKTELPTTMVDSTGSNDDDGDDLPF